MKQNNRLVQLQNEYPALTYLRASHYCLQKEKSLKYLMIFLSFGICLAAIFNRYLPQMMPHAENAESIQQIVATIINLISGVIIIVGLVLGFYVSRMHTEGTVLQDKYEAYVFGTLNPTILRPISQTMVEEYARKTKRISDEQFEYFLFDEDDEPKMATAQFDYIYKVVHNDYKLYLSIQPFFLTIWIGFCVIVFIIAISFNDTFVTTLINILIPSLSAITTIGNSWYGCRLQMRQLQNLINITEQIDKLPESKKMLYISDERNMRLLADGLFNYRSSAFVIPTFLEKRFNKSVKSENMAHSKLNINTKENKESNKAIKTTCKKKPDTPIKQVLQSKQRVSQPIAPKPVAQQLTIQKTVVKKSVNAAQKRPTATKSQTSKKTASTKVDTANKNK